MIRRAHRPGHCRERRRGFAIMELLVLLGMLALIMLAAGRLFESTVRLGHTTGEAANAAATMRSLGNALRGDAWVAGEFQAAGDKMVTFVVAGSTSVTWKIESDAIVRTRGNDTRRWPIMEGSTFAIDVPSVVLKIPATEEFAGGEVRAASETQLLTKVLR